jgi:hypothetical protein
VNAKSLRQKPASWGTAIEPCTSRRLGAAGAERQPFGGLAGAGVSVPNVGIVQTRAVFHDPDVFCHDHSALHVFLNYQNNY